MKHFFNAVILVMLSLSLSAQAATYYWDNNGTTAGFGTAGGTWAVPTVSQWSTDSTGVAAPGASISTTSADPVNFGTSTTGLLAGTITISGSVTNGSITFGSTNGAVVLNGGTINLNGNIAVSAASPAATHTINSDIVLVGNRQFGAVLVNERMIFNGTISGTSGSGLTADTSNGSGSITLNGTNSFPGNFTMGRGQVIANNVANAGVNSSLGAGTTITMAYGGGQNPSFVYSGASAGSMNRNFVLNGGSDYFISQGAPLTLSGIFSNTSASFNPVISLSGDAGGGANFNEISGTIVSGSVLNISVAVQILTPVGGTGEEGIWKLSGNNTYTGATSVANSSTLIVAHNNALGATGGGVNLTQFAQLLLMNNIAVGTEALTLNSLQTASWNGQSGAALRNYSGNNSWAGPITLSRASTIAANSGTTLTLSGGISGINNLTFNADGDITVTNAGITTGTGTLSKNGAGTLTLSAVNTFTGEFDIFGGTLRLGGAGQLGGGTYDSSPNTTFIASGATFDFSSSANQTISSAFINAGGITVGGPGALTLSGPNTYTGPTTITGGTLRAGSATAFNNYGALIMTNGSGTLDLNGNNVRFTASTLSSATATIIDNASGSGTSTAALGTVGSSFETSTLLIKDGPTRKVAITLVNNNQGASFNNGGNTFSGGLTLLNGTRMLPGVVVAGAYGTGPITLGQAATDGVNILFQSASQTLANDMVFNAALGTDYKGIRLDATGMTFPGTLTANLAPITFSAFGTGGATLTGKQTGPYGFTVEDSTFGTLTITLNNAAANNDYQGATKLVTAKSFLALGANNQIPNGASAGNVTNNGTFRLNGFSDTINGLSGTGIVDGVSGTPTLTVGDNNATGVSNTFVGVITDTAGTLSLTKIGNGDLFLNGVNTYSGTTLVNAGTIGGSGTIAGPVSVTASAKLAAGSATGAVGKLTLGSTLALSGASLTFDLNTPGTAGVDYDQIAVTDALTMSGVNTINLNVLGGYIVDGTYTLITFGASTASTFTFANGTTTMILSGATLTLVNSTTSLQLTVVGAPKALKWQGPSASTIWDTVTANWLNGVAASVFTAGDDVTFDDSASTFTVTGSGSPASVVITNKDNAYTVSAAIGGSGTTLRKTGTNTLTLSGNSTYSGGSLLAAGETRIQSGTALGTGAIQVGDNTGTVSFVMNAANIGLTNNVTVMSDGELHRLKFTNNVAIHGDIALNVTAPIQLRLYNGSNDTDRLDVYGDITGSSASGGFTIENAESFPRYAGTVALHGDNRGLKGYIDITSAGKLEVYHNNALGADYPVTVRFGWNTPSLRLGQGVVAGANNVTMFKGANLADNVSANIGLVSGATSAELAADFDHQAPSSLATPKNFSFDAGSGQTLTLSGNLHGTGDWYVNGNGKNVFSGSGSTATGRFMNDRGWVEFGHPNALANMIIETWLTGPKYSAASAGMIIPNNTVIMTGNTSYYTGTNDFTMAGSLKYAAASGTPSVFIDSSASVTFAGDVGVGTHLGTNGVNPPISYKTGSGNLRFTHTDPEVEALYLNNATGRIELGASTLLTMYNGAEIWSTTGGSITGGTLTTKAGGDGRLNIRNYGTSNLVIDSLIRFSNTVNHVQIVDVIAYGSGAIRLSNTNNTFSQGGIGGVGVSIWSGVLETDRIGNHGSPSPLGGGQFPSDGRVFFTPSPGSNAILRYTGPGESASRELFAFGDASTLHKIEASGSGDLILSGGYFGAGGGATKTWAFGGTGTGRVSASRIIYDPAAVRKVDSGTWKFDTQSQNYSGTTLIEDGMFVMNTRYDSNGAWSVSSGAILAGNGSIKAALTVNGVLSPGDNGMGTFSVTNNVTWGSTVTPGVDTDWQWDLGASDTADLLYINGDFIKSGSGSFRFNVGGSPPAGTYTLVQWTGSTTFNPSDFSVTGLQGGLSSSFAIVGKTLVLSIGNCSGGIPTITLGTFPSSCGSVEQLALPYLSTTLGANKYTINYDATANTANFVDVVVKQPLGIINDNFLTGSVVTNDTRIRESDIDNGWQAVQEVTYVCRQGSGWRITSGRMENAVTNKGAYVGNCSETANIASGHYPAGEGPVLQVVTVNGRSGGTLKLSFDYSVAAGDTLNVNLVGITGEFDLDDDFIGNTEERSGIGFSEITNPSRAGEIANVSKYDLSDGDQGVGYLVQLTGTGTYTTNINIAARGISGVSDISDLSYIGLALAKDEDGLPGTTWFDNVLLTSDSLPIAVPPALPNGNYSGTVSVFNDANCSGSANFTVTITDGAPNTPGAISGATRVCAPNTVAYSIAQVPGAVGYVWSLPAHATMASVNQTETEIVVNWVSGGVGDITVYAEGVCEAEPNSGIRTLTVIADGGLPVAPTALPAANITQSGFDARWNATIDSDSYRLDMATLPDFSAASIVVTNELWTDETKDTRTFSNLEIGNYYYRIRATNACGTSPNSGIITVTVSQVIANWDTSAQTGGAGNYGVSPLAPRSFAGTYVSVTGLTRQAGVATAGTGAADGWGGEGWNAVDQASAEAANDAMTFTIVPKAGVNVNYTTIDVLSYMRQANGPTDGMLQYALNNGSFVDIGPLTYPSTAVGGATAPEVPIDLSAVSALQNVNVPVTFRVVNWGASDAAADWYIFDQNQSTSPDLQLIGSFCLSPNTYAMTGGGVYCLPGGDAPSIGLADSEANVAYQLYINTGGGPVVDGSTVLGTGSALDFGTKTATGTYTVVATRLSGSGCSANMTGSAVVSEATTPAVPTGLTATFDALDGDIDLAWNAAAGATNYTVSRATIQGGPYTVIANSGSTSYSDTTVIRNTIEYFYVVTASSSGCASAYSDEVSDSTDTLCQTGVAPTLNAPGNRTVNVGQSVQHAITATDSAISCGTPNITNYPSTLPAYISYVDTPSGASVTRTYTIAPTGGDSGDAQPIRVLTWDNEANAVTNQYSFMVYVGSSAANSYSIPITALNETTPGSAADLTWDADQGVAYDVHSTTTPPGANPVWTKIKSAVPANDVSVTESVVADGGMRFYQVAPAGISRTDRDIWGIVRPSVPAGTITYMAPPLPETTSDLDFSGNLGDALAAALTDPDDRIYVMAPGENPGWTILRLVGGEWIIDGGGSYTTPLNEGQGFLVIRDSGSASPTFEGPVGNDGQSSISLQVGYNIIGVSEGQSLPALTAFENASPVGSYDEDQADQVVLLNSDGSFRRLWRLGNGTWYDTETQGTTTLTLQPGQAYYYIRRSSGTTLSF